MLNFMDSCIDNEHFNEKCSAKIQEFLGIDSKKVNLCVENSYEKAGKNQKETGNRLLAEDRKIS